MTLIERLRAAPLFGSDLHELAADALAAQDAEMLERGKALTWASEEMAEQCRLLGISGSREARLMAQVEEGQREIERLKKTMVSYYDDIHSCHADCDRAGCVNARLRAENEALRVANTQMHKQASLVYAENDALRVDAERWSWWSGNTGAIRNASGVPVFHWPRPEPLGYLMKGCVAQHLNSAVDAAMKGTP